MANLIESIETISDAIDTVNVYDNGQLGVVYMSSNKEYLYGIAGDVDEVVSTIRYTNEMVRNDRNSTYSVGRTVHSYRRDGVLTEI